MQLDAVHAATWPLLAVTSHPVTWNPPLSVKLCGKQVLKCQHYSGGFGGSERHDPHMLYTLSAVQVLALHDKLHLLDADLVVSCKPQLYYT